MDSPSPPRQHDQHDQQDQYHLDYQSYSQHHDQATQYINPTTPIQDKDEDVASSSSSSSSPRKPYSSFDTNNDLDKDLFDLEDDYISSANADRKLSGKSWRRVADIMTARSRRNGSEDSSVYRDEGKALLGGRHTRRRRRKCFNYCIFGGISGLGILATLLTTNLLLTLATIYWTTDPDDIFTHWGGLSSGTEGLNWYPTDFTRGIQPIACHSHNDYWRRVPLFSALHAGCTGVEADVWLFKDDLFVGHNTGSLTANRTFTALYIDPLVRILEHQNPSTEFYNGTMNGVFDVDPEQTLTLLIDVKTSGEETWPWILKQLEPLRERGWLTFVEGETVHKRPITVVGTGNTRFDVLTRNATYRDAFFDAPLDTMWEPLSSPIDSPGASSPSSSEIDPSTALSPLSKDAKSHSPDLGQGLSGTSPTSSFTALNSYYASVSLPKAIGHLWLGRLSDSQMKIIRGQIKGAHARGLKTRYWDLPAWPIGLRDHVWDVLIKEGVDVLNVDDLRAASRFSW